MVDLSTLSVCEYGLLFLYLYLCSYVRLGSSALLTRFQQNCWRYKLDWASADSALNQLSHELDVLFYLSGRLSILNIQKHWNHTVQTTVVLAPKPSQTHQGTGHNSSQEIQDLLFFTCSLNLRPLVWLLLATPYSWSLSPQSLSLTTHTTRNPRWAEYRTDVEDLTPIVEVTPAPLPLLAPQMCQQSMSLLSLRGLSSLHGGHCSRQHSL